MKDAEFIYSLYVQANPVPDPDEYTPPEVEIKDASVGGLDAFAINTPRPTSKLQGKVLSAPEAVATAATPPSRAAIRFSNTSVVGFMIRV